MHKFLLLLVLFCSAAAMALEPLHKWDWNSYVERNMPEIKLSAGERLDGILTLPDKRVVKARKFAFPESGSTNLYKLLDPAPRSGERTVITADFTLDKPQRLVLGMGVAWWTKVYLNGRLIFDSSRTGNSEKPINYNNHHLEIKGQAGRNQLVWEARGLSVDFTFALKLKNWPELALRYPPWSMFPDSRDNGISVVFSLTRPAPAAVDHRLKGTDKWTRCYNNLAGIIRRDKAIHHIRLTDLEPDKVYEYRAVVIDETNMFKEIPLPEIYTFKTAPAATEAKKFSFIATSDLQITPRERLEFMQQILSRPESISSSFFTFVGDLSWLSDFDQVMMDNFVAHYRTACGNRLPLVMVRGNHEIYGWECAKYFDYFQSPGTGDNSFYLFRYGDVCFVVLDFLNDTPRCPYPATQSQMDFAPHLKAQKRFLQAAVNSPEFQTAKFRIVLCHAVPVGDWKDFMPGNVRDTIDPVFGSANPKHRIHLWIGGHTHRALRSIPLANRCRSVIPMNFAPQVKHPQVGQNYVFPVVVMGGPNRNVEKAFYLTSLNVAVNNDTLEVKHFDRQNKLFDHIAIAPDGTIREIYSDPQRFKHYSY